MIAEVTKDGYDPRDIICYFWGPYKELPSNIDEHSGNCKLIELPDDVESFECRPKGKEIPTYTYDLDRPKRVVKHSCL